MIDGAINYFSIIYAKGLEFEEVYVIEKDLNQNEKYVAYTRALSVLNVIEYNESEQEKITSKLAALFEKFKKITKKSK